MDKKKAEKAAPENGDKPQPEAFTFIPTLGGQVTLRGTDKHKCITTIEDGFITFGDGTEVEIEQFEALYEPTPPADLPIQGIENAVTVDVAMRRTPDYPERTETRDLMVRYTPDEIEVMSRQISETVIELARIPGIKKALVEKQATLADNILAEEHETEVQCRWIFECAGRDSSTGEKIYSATHKTLFREDTGKAVEVIMMTGADHQLELNYRAHPEQVEEAPAPAHREPPLEMASDEQNVVEGDFGHGEEAEVHHEG